MCWESITAIATSLTVLAVLGGALMMHLLTKPRVAILSVSPIGWFYIFEGGNKRVGTKVSVNLRLENSGSEKTFIKGKFLTQDGKIFTLSGYLPLEGHGTIFDTILCFDLPKEKGFPLNGEVLHGFLKLEPWGNRRLWFGKKYLTAKIDIPENQLAKNVLLEG